MNDTYRAKASLSNFSEAHNTAAAGVLARGEAGPCRSAKSDSIENAVWLAASLHVTFCQVYVHAFHNAGRFRGFSFCRPLMLLFKMYYVYRT